MADKCKVLSMQRLPSADPQRLGKYDRLFVVEVAAGNTLVVRVPDEGFDEAKLQAAIRAELQERGKWVGRELEL